MSKYYYKKKKNSWEKVFQDTVKEFSKSINKMFRKGSINANYNINTCNNNSGAAKVCVITLIVITLLFSGIGFYSWIILGMLCIILQFL